MIRVYIYTLFINALLILLGKVYAENNINNIIEKTCLFKETIGFDNKPPKSLFYILCPIVNMISILVMSYILFSKYEDIEKTIEWMNSEKQ